MFTLGMSSQQLDIQDFQAFRNLGYSLHGCLLSLLQTSFLGKGLSVHFFMALV